MPNLEKLSANKLAAEIEKRRQANSIGLKALIAAGYGNLTGSELDSMVEDGTASQLVIDARKASLAYAESLWELDARRRYHGSDKPIKRPKFY